MENSGNQMYESSSRNKMIHFLKISICFSYIAISWIVFNNQLNIKDSILQNSFLDKRFFNFNQNEKRSFNKLDEIVENSIGTKFISKIYVKETEIEHDKNNVKRNQSYHMKNEISIKLFTNMRIIQKRKPVSKINNSTIWVKGPYLNEKSFGQNNIFKFDMEKGFYFYLIFLNNINKVVMLFIFQY